MSANRVFIYRPHRSGIGFEFVREIQSLERPSFDLGYWQDCTNRVWALWEEDWRRKQQQSSHA